MIKCSIHLRKTTNGVTRSAQVPKVKNYYMRALNLQKQYFKYKSVSSQDSYFSDDNTLRKQLCYSAERTLDTLFGYLGVACTVTFHPKQLYGFNKSRSVASVRLKSPVCKSCVGSLDLLVVNSKNYRQKHQIKFHCTKLYLKEINKTFRSAIELKFID